MRIAVIGHSTRILGVGEAARRLTQTLLNYDFEVQSFSVKFGKSPVSKEAVTEQGFSKKNFDLIILAVNPDLLVPTLFSFGLALDISVPKIGFWSWEFADCPASWSFASELLDEIWTISDFTKSAISRVAINSRVKVAPLSPDYGRREMAPFNFQEIGLEANKFTVLISFDFFSNIQRKNPHAAISAFHLAFGKNSKRCQLIIKCINSEGYQSEINALQGLVRRENNIRILDYNMTRDRYNQLLSSSSVFLSLHRCEGYGLNLFDALANGVKVIATQYSGNLEFQNPENSLLVKSSIVPVSLDYSLYKVKSHWASPSVEDAAAKLVEAETAPWADNSKRLKAGHRFLQSFEKLAKARREAFWSSCLELKSQHAQPKEFHHVLVGKAMRLFLIFCLFSIQVSILVSYTLRNRVRLAKNSSLVIG